MSTKVIFWIGFFIAYVLQAITGFAGGILSMPIGIFTIGVSNAFIVLNVCGCLACGAIVLMNLKHIDWPEFWRIGIVTTIFLFVGIWIHSKLEFNLLIKIFGFVVLIIALQKLLVKKQHEYPKWALFLFLVLGGLTQGMFVAGGPFIALYALQTMKDKEKFRVTFSLILTFLYGVYAVIGILNGDMTGEAMSITAGCIPLTILAVILGQKIEKHMSQQFFLQLTYWLLLLIGIILLFK